MSKTRHDRVGKVIRWKMCKKLKFNYTNKWYMHNPASVLENDTLLWDFDIRTDLLILARRPDLIIINKKRELAKLCTLLSWMTTEKDVKGCEKKNKYLNLARELKKLWDMDVTIIPIVISAFGTVTKGLLKGLKILEVDRRVEKI